MQPGSVVPAFSFSNNSCDVGCGYAPAKHSLASCPTLVYRYHGVCNVGVVSQLLDVVLHPSTHFYCVGQEYALDSAPVSYREFILVSELPLERLRGMMPSVPNFGYASAAYEPDFVVDSAFVAHVLAAKARVDGISGPAELVRSSTPTPESSSR